MACGELVGRDGLFEKLKELGIETTTAEHPEVFTVEEMMPYLEKLPGLKCKNLFLRDKKRKLWLLTARHDAEVKLDDIGKKVGAKNMRLAPEDILYAKMGVKQGCVTPFALINNKDNDVTFLLDEAVMKGGHEKAFFHPMDNSASTAISPDDLMKFVAATNHSVTLIQLGD